ncbi:tRNA lysidine(34) synthetase TilS [Pelobium manganitolerans]|uniref:tRNA(Ile)-lysidine synthase n=1 Tax=Pelobium manganitolerans TaxID=1842495 RepID=A0A419SA57_9SPHI|nr:tRNA lysidine(34) synthetase TilS [Pelobium manganitolerans]RKD19083.1 tRNA lysidine(34) synthetase TilS [Pelobium manganitolerans]
MLSAKKRLLQFIQQQKLLKTNAKVLLAVSGGKDSVLMAQLFADSPYLAGMVHCNFNLRGEESARDEAFVRDLAKTLNMPLFFKSFDTKAYADEQKISIQMAARELRYQLFEDVRATEGFDKIAVAQHQNDAVETVLINLIRGTGVAGLHGIKSDRQHIIRPMLCFKASEIEDLVQQNAIAYVEDSSNASNKYFRNKIRLDIIPEMEKLNPSLIHTFQENIRHFAQLEELLQQQTDLLKNTIVHQQDNGIRIKIEDIRSLQPQQLLLFELLKPYGFKGAQVDDLLADLERQSGKLFLSPTHCLSINRGYAEIYPLNTKAPESQEIFGAGSYHFGDATISVSESAERPKNLKDKNVAFVEAERLSFPLKLRAWQKGDTFMPFGMRKLKKLSDFFVAEKIPLNHKKHIPILENGNGDIIWVCPYRTDERYKVGAGNKKIFIFEYRK